jgi:hypothetical protein
MTGGYAIMTFRLRGHCGRSNKTFNDIYGPSPPAQPVASPPKISPANKRMAGGGNQKHVVPSSIGRQYYLFSHIARNTSSK